jgi:hypothetical protein
MHQRLCEILFPQYRLRVLQMLLLNPEGRFHGREIARRVRLPAGTLVRELRRLADVGVLNRKRHGRQMRYSANVDCVVFSELVSILSKLSGVVAVIAAMLTPLADRIEVGFILGPAMRPESRDSALEVFLIGSVDQAAVDARLHPLQSLLARRVIPRVFSAEQWQGRMKAAGRRFKEDVLTGPKSFVIGGKRELTKLGGGRW